MEAAPGSLEAMAANQRSMNYSSLHCDALAMRTGDHSVKKKSNNYATTVFAALPEVKATRIKRAAHPVSGTPARRQENHRGGLRATVERIHQTRHSYRRPKWLKL
jgi:hypothetical protein